MCPCVFDGGWRRVNSSSLLTRKKKDDLFKRPGCILLTPCDAVFSWKDSLLKIRPVCVREEYFKSLCLCVRFLTSKNVKRKTLITSQQLQQSDTEPGLLWRSLWISSRDGARLSVSSVTGLAEFLFASYLARLFFFFFFQNLSPNFKAATGEWNRNVSR